jgi:small subunit ribosomal protein S17
MAMEDTAEGRGRRQVLTGVVVSNKMDKTVIVAVERTVVDRLYRRYLKQTTKLAAHDEANACKAGDKVEIVSTRPLSRSKRWRVLSIVSNGDGGAT